MAPDDAPDERGFLSRWSRRKAQVRQGEAPPEPPRPTAAPAPAAATRVTPAPVAPIAPVAPAVATRAPAPARPTEAPGPAQPPPPTLDDLARIDALDAHADFSRFVQPDVAPALKNAALKKLFSDPHFNVMDGLDIYIDDYGRADPLPPGMLEQMAGSDFLGLRTPEPPPPAVPRPVAATADTPDPAAAATAAAPGETAPPADPAVTAPANDPTAPAADTAPAVATVTSPPTNTAAAPPLAPLPPNDPARPRRP